MLTAHERDEMQTLMVASMPDRGEVLRFARVRDGLDFVDTWAIIATNVPVRVFEPSGVRSFEGGNGERVSSAGYPIVRVPHGTDIDESDRLTIGGTRTLEVTRKVITSYSFAVTLLCTEVR